MDKNSFLIYLDYEEQFNLLTDEQVGQLIRAIIKYEKSCEIPKLDGMLKMAFSFIKTQLDRDREKYNKKCEKNRENAKKGGRPKKQKDIKKPNGFEESEGNFEKTKKPDNDNEDDNEDDIDNDLLSKEEKEEKLQQRFIECLNSFNENAINECIAYLDKLPFEVIEYVLKKTSGISNPNWNYTNTILEDYCKKGINTLEKVRAEEIKFKNKTVKKETQKTNFEGRQYTPEKLNGLYANLPS